MMKINIFKNQGIKVYIKIKQQGVLDIKGMFQNKIM